MKKDFYIQPNVLIRIWKEIKREPLKTWVRSDFASNCGCNIHLHTLIKMGLVEEVSGKYWTGKSWLTKREVKGYRMINLNTLNNSEKHGNVKPRKSIT